MGDEGIIEDGEEAKEEEKEEKKVKTKPKVEAPKCPAFYTNMAYYQRNELDKFLSQFESNSEQLVKKLMKRVRRSRIDCNKLAIWWFYQIQMKEEKKRLYSKE